MKKFDLDKKLSRYIYDRKEDALFEAIAPYVTELKHKCELCGDHLKYPIIKHETEIIVCEKCYMNVKSDLEKLDELLMQYEPELRKEKPDDYIIW